MDKSRHCSTREDLSLVLSTQARWLTIAHNFSSRGEAALFWPLKALHLFTHRNTHTKKKKKVKTKIVEKL